MRACLHTLSTLVCGGLRHARIGRPVMARPLPSSARPGTADSDPVQSWVDASHHESVDCAGRQPRRLRGSRLDDRLFGFGEVRIVQCVEQMIYEIIFSVCALRAERWRRPLPYRSMRTWAQGPGDIEA